VSARVASSTQTLPGSATDCTREAVLTASPATIPSAVAPRVTATSPVTTPTRMARPGAPTSSPIAVMVWTSSSPARTARSASSSWATGTPHTAITASPMNFSTVPPYRPITVRHWPKYRDRSSRTSSASRDSDSVVNPTRSPNSTEVTRRSAIGRSGSGGGATPAPNTAPHWPQNRPPSSGAPQEAHSATRAIEPPQSRQNLRSADIDAAQCGHCFTASPRWP
jgi:hypothetical protein